MKPLVFILLFCGSRVLAETCNLKQDTELSLVVDATMPNDLRQPWTEGESEPNAYQSVQDLLDISLSLSSESPTAINIGKALETAEKTVASKNEKIVVLVSSKESSDNTLPISISMKQANIKIISVSLGKTLEGVASLASSPEYAFTLDVQHAPSLLVPQIMSKICSESTPAEIKIPAKPHQLNPFFNAMACPAGYTGQYCQIPMCPMKGQAKPYAPAAYGYPIDITVLNTCSGQSSFPVDSHVNGTITLLLLTQANAGVPSLTVYKPNGQIIQANETVNKYNDSEIIIYDIPNPMMGIWKAVYKKTGTPVICLFTSYAYTGLYVDPGFIPVSQKSAAPLSDNPSNAISQGVPNFFVAHAQGLPCPGKISYMQIFENNALIWESQSQVRYHCAYEYYFGWIYCNSVSSYYYKVFGVDENGYLWQRTDTMYCVKPPPTTTPAPTQYCHNGGVLTNGKCVCPATWSGPQCNTPICFNGGTVHITSTSLCQCASGWTGIFCRIDTCAKQNPNVMNGPNNRSLTFVVQTTITMGNDVSQLQANIDYIISQINQQTLNTPNHWFSQYTLITFDNATVTNVMTTTNTGLFTYAIKNVLKSGIKVVQGVRTVAALKLALQSALPYSPIYVFSDTNPSDWFNYPNLWSLIDSSKNTINFMFTNVNPGGKPFGYSYGTQTVQLLSTISDGQLFVDNKQILTQLIRVIPTHYQNGLVFEQVFQDCSKGQTVFFPIDSRTSAFTFYTVGQNPMSQLYSPSNALYHGAPLVNGSHYTHIQHVTKRHGTGKSNLVPGIWKVILKTTPFAGSGSAPCTFQVRAQSALQVYYGFTQNPHNDFANPEPLYGKGITNMMVAHVTNLNPLGTLEYVNLVRWYWYYNQTIYGSAQFMPRQNCSYEWYSQTFTCPKLYFGLAITGYDGQGYLYQRLRIAQCQYASSGAPAKSWIPHLRSSDSAVKTVDEDWSPGAAAEYLSPDDAVLKIFAPDVSSTELYKNK